MSFAHKWCFTKERWYGNCKKVIVYLILGYFTHDESIDVTSAVASMLS